LFVCFFVCSFVCVIMSIRLCTFQFLEKKN
jgi:hypothetical protein